MKGYECVVWDWNGTLLDDVDVNIGTINILLTKRALPPVPSRDAYLDSFRFPVIDYYTELGFDIDTEDFCDIAAEYVEVYGREMEKARLFDGAEDVLSALSRAGIRQVIVSAAEGERLRGEVARYGIDGYFTDVLGTGDNRGDGKVHLGMRFVAESGIAPAKVLFVGDMLHDAEVAAACGCDVLFVARGHMSKDRLLTYGARVADDISDVVRAVL